MATSVLVSCITPFLNASPWLPDQLEALSRQTCRAPREFIFADNGSTDRSRDIILAWAERLRAPLRIIDASGRRGSSHALNCALGVARGEWLAFCDADDRVNDLWLEALLEKALQTGADFVSASARDWDGSSGTNPEKLWHAAERPHLGFLPMMQNGNMLGRAEAVRALGGWNENFLTGEDAEFSWRAQLAGYRLVSTPEAILDYRRRSTNRGMFWQHFRYGRDDIRLLKLFSGHPRPRRTWHERWREVRPIPATGYHWLLGRVTPAQKAHAIRLLGKKLGQFVGSLQTGYFYL
jgi:glycosyltransferase involved in cell wall biosynthesis